MNIQELKEKHPAVYAEAVAVGVKQEKERAEAWAYFAEVDPKGVQEGIKAGATMTQLQMIEFSEKKASKKELAAIEGEGAKPLAVGAEKDAAEKSAKEAAAAKEEQAFAAKLDELLFPNKAKK